MVCLISIVISTEVQNSNLPSEIRLFENGVNITKYIIIIMVIDTCINVVRLNSYILDSKSKSLFYIFNSNNEANYLYSV